jgi:hypothetical protein
VLVSQVGGVAAVAVQEEDQPARIRQPQVQRRKGRAGDRYGDLVDVRQSESVRRRQRRRPEDQPLLTSDMLARPSRISRWRAPLSMRGSPEGSDDLPEAVDQWRLRQQVPRPRDRRGNVRRRQVRVSAA